MEIVIAVVVALVLLALLAVAVQRKRRSGGVIAANGVGSSRSRGGQDQPGDGPS